MSMIERWQDAELDEHLKQYETMECCRCGEVKYLDELIECEGEKICEECN
jgi:formylmethanofuran dehydrogenase subunit E